MSVGKNSRSLFCRYDLLHKAGAKPCPDITLNLHPARSIGQVEGMNFGDVLKSGRSRRTGTRCVFAHRA